MPRLAPVHWKTLECVFEKYGFKFKRQASSHRVYEKKGVLRPVIIPTYDDVLIDIIKKNMNTAGISREEYFELLSQC